MNTTDLIKKWNSGEVLTDKELRQLSVGLHTILQGLLGAGDYYKAIQSYTATIQSQVLVALEARAEEIHKNT